MVRRGSTQEKILLLLLSGVGLGLSRSSKGYFKILKSAHQTWKEINRRSLSNSIRALYISKLVQHQDNKDGTITLILSSEGKEIALTFNLEKMTIRRHKWDKKWRIIIFDIPEKKKKLREIFRYHLKRLGFIDLQHSVFVLPFECKSEMEYLIEFYNLRRFVRFIEAHHIDNELDLKQKFNIL